MKKFISIFQSQITSLNSLGFRSYMEQLPRRLLSALLFRRLFISRIKSPHIEFNTKCGPAGDLPFLSVVLPVNNGLTRGVSRLIDSLQAQKHVKVEIIAVDSGSTDGTIAFLESVGVYVYSIPSHKFSHAYSRNYGARYAKGEFILFTVDDAVFFDQFWCAKAVKLLQTSGASSVSGVQNVDHNADVYAVLLAESLTNSQARSRGSQVTRVKAAQVLSNITPFHLLYPSVAIDDTNHLVVRKVFEGLRFESDTVEDIDFAMRLMKNGGQICFSSDLTILHYHRYNKELLPRYFTRVYLDTIEMSKYNIFRPRHKSAVDMYFTFEYILMLIIESDDNYVEFLINRKYNNPTYTMLPDERVEFSNYVEFICDCILKSRRKARPASVGAIQKASAFLQSLGVNVEYVGSARTADILYMTDILVADFRMAAKVISRLETHRVLSKEDAYNCILHLFINKFASTMASWRFTSTDGLSFDVDITAWR